MSVSDSVQQGKPGVNLRLTVGSEACLEGATEPLKEVIRRELTFVNPKYEAAKRHSKWIGKKLKEKLYFYTDLGPLLCFPRGYIREARELCKQVTGKYPEIINKRRSLDEIDLTFHGELRPYQEKAVAEALKKHFGVLEAGTGSGKTIMALKIIAERKQPTLIIVHNKELLYQWRQRITDFLHIEAGQAGDGIYEIKPITVAIVNSARNHLDTLPKQFGQIIVDECHRVPASLFTNVVSSFDSYYMLGLSATAFRREDGMTRLISIYMGMSKYRVNPKVLEETGAIVRPELVQRLTEFRYGVFRGDYAKLIKSLTKNDKRNEQIAADAARIIQAGHEGTVLIVSDRVAHCEILQKKILDHGIDSALLTGQTPADRRLQIVEEVKAGAIQVLISTLQLIGEGFDCPGLSTLILSTPIKFEGRLLQVAGRIMRPSENKKAQIIDYIDNIPVLKRSAEIRRQVFDRW